MTEGNKSLALTFLVWWYKEAFTRFFLFLRQFVIYLTDLFSVKLLLKTLFAPWKRDQISAEGQSLQQRFQVWSLNLTSRLIGAVVKLIVMLVFLAVASFALLLAIIAIIVWLLWPILTLAIIWYGIRLILG